jgi:LuxR family glucitol operon transcriptional activator
MSIDEIPQLIGVANDRVLAKTGKALGDTQACILDQALKGRKLKDIRVIGYADSTIQRVLCPELWELLSDATGHKVRVNTVRLVLEKLLKESHPGSLRNENSSSASWASPLSPLPSVQPSPPKRLQHNLPAPSCTTFIGRKQEVARLMELLSPNHAAHLISIDGIGGVGKTTLVVEAAYRCLRASYSDGAFPGVPTFEAIIFTSAKECYLTPFGVLKSLAPRRTLNDIFRQIARTLDDLDITGASFVEQVDLIKDSLSRQRTLMIVDNLETVENQQDVLAFLYELPPTVKTVITTREQIMFVPVRLTSLPQPDALHLIQYEAQEKGVTLSPEDSHALYHGTGGVPVAISYAIGQLANGYPIEEVLERMSQTTGDVAHFCFESSVKPLRGQAAHKLLMTLALFPMPAPREALVQVAVPEDEPDVVKNALARLRGLSLVRHEENHYGILPLTREYALTELSAHPDFERDARERWIGWYLSFSQKYSEQDAKEWQAQFEGLEEEWPNLQAVIDFCVARGRYADLLKLWRNTQAYTYTMGSRKSRLGHWDDRLLWTASLIQSAEQRGDWSVLAEILVDRGWTLTAMGKPSQLEEADQLFARAWELRHYQNPLFELSLSKNIAILRIQQHRFDEAQSWFGQTLELVEQAQLQEQQRLRWLTQICYYQGEIRFKTEEYEQAKILFQEALQYAQTIDWKRGIFCTQNWLADISVKQGELEKAQKLLNEGLRVAQVNQDKVRVAFCQRSLASLARAQGNLTEARRWATEAFNNFESIGMLPEAEETRTFLSTLDTTLSER